MNQLLSKILSHPKNTAVLHFLQLPDTTVLSQSFRSWKESYSAFDEGACLLFDQYGRSIPDECKFSLDDHSIMVNEQTGELFAFNTGRFSVFFACDFVKAGIRQPELVKKGYTFDCITDISTLGGNWSFMDHFENQEEQLLWSWELTKL